MGNVTSKICEGCAGLLRAAGTGSDYWLVRTDHAGNKTWDRSFGTAGVETVRSVHKTRNRGFIFAGKAGVIKTDSQGQIEWQHSFSKPSEPNPYTVEIKDLQPAADGGFILAGDFQSIGDRIDPSRCETGGWAARIENVVSNAGDVITWKATDGAVLESVGKLNGEWGTNQSDILSIGTASALRIIPTSQQRYFRLRTPEGTSPAPSLSFAGLLSWPANSNQKLQTSSTKQSPWSDFAGDHGEAEGTRYAIVPQALKQDYFRTRK